MENTHPTYDEIDSMSRQLAAMFQHGENNNDVTIVGISRGGLLPAVIMSHQLNLPMVPIMYSSINGNGETNKKDLSSLQNIKTKRIWLIDELDDSGYTLKELSAICHDEMKFEVRTGTLYHKSMSVFEPDYYVNYQTSKEWIRFPWERLN